MIGILERKITASKPLNIYNIVWEINISYEAFLTRNRLFLWYFWLISLFLYFSSDENNLQAGYEMLQILWAFQHSKQIKNITEKYQICVKNRRPV